MQIRIWRVLLQILQLGQDTLVCSVINDWRSQNGARASVTQTTAPLIPLFCSYHILISSTIYYWTDARKYEIYLLKRHQVIVAFYAIHLAKQCQWTEYTLCSSDIQLLFPSHLPDIRHFNVNENISSYSHIAEMKHILASERSNSGHFRKKNWPHIHRYIWSEQLANTTRRQHTPDETSNQSHQSPLPWK